jgi:hypothetical protein
MTRNQKPTTSENLSELIRRIRHENEALQHLINALEERSKPIDKKILNK